MAVVLEVPVLHGIKYIPPRHRLDHSGLAIARVAVRVSEIPEERAPGAIRATLPDGRELTYRLLGESLVRPLWLPGAEGPVLVRRDGAQAAFDAFEALLNARDVNAKKMLWPLLPARQEIHRLTSAADIGRISSSERDPQVAATRDTLQHGSAFIGGVLHVPSKGPAWKVVNDRKQPGPQLVLVQEAGWSGSAGGWHPWSERRAAEIKLYERAAMGDYATAIGGSYQPRKVIGPTLGRCVAATGAPEHGHGTLVRDVAAAVRSQLKVAAGNLFSLSPSAIHAYADLKQVSLGGVDEETLDAAVSALRQFRAECAAPAAQPQAESDPVAALLARVDAEAGGIHRAVEPEAVRPGHGFDQGIP